MSSAGLMDITGHGASRSESQANIDVLSHNAAERAKRLRRFEDVGLSRTHNGFYYISHYFPIRAQSEVSAAEAERLLASVDSTGGFETYMHFPFCEVLCTFCHFFKERSKAEVGPREDTALSALEHEIDLYGSILGKIDAHSLQMGGGTPSLMSNAGLKRILKFVHQRLSFDSTAEKKIEIYPKYYDRAELSEKLEILHDYGFTDIVIDLESGNQKTLNVIGRGNSSLEAYCEVVELCVARGFKSIVTALMMGLPHETFESLHRTVETILSIPEVQVVNTFPTIIREGDAIFRHLKKRPQDFADAEGRDAMWMFVRDQFRAHGFSEGPISYQHRPSKRPQQQSEKFECVNLLGFGPSAFAYWNGPDWAAQCFNFCNLHDYYERLEKNELPLWRAGVMGQEERSRRKIIFGLANCKTENLNAIEERFGISVDQVFGKMLNGLLELGLIELDVSGGGIHYTEEGLCRLEEISYFFGSDYVNDIVARPIPIENPHQADLRRFNFYPYVEPDARARFRRFVENQPSAFMQRLVELQPH
jgi:oxygen-independent coproporphyrinogen-3 oxidase